MYNEKAKIRYGVVPKRSQRRRLEVYCEGSSLPWVRIPPTPPKQLQSSKGFEPERATSVKKQLQWSFFNELIEGAKRLRYSVRSTRVPPTPPKQLQSSKGFEPFFLLLWSILYRKFYVIGFNNLYVVNRLCITFL